MVGRRARHEAPNTDQTWSADPRAPHRPTGNRSPPLARAPPAITLGGRCLQPAGPTRRGGLCTERRPSLRAPPRPTPAERDRDAPSAHSGPPTGRPRLRPPLASPRGTLRRRSGRLRRRARRLFFSNPSTASRTPATDPTRWKRGRGRSSSVTRPRPGYEVDCRSRPSSTRRRGHRAAPGFGPAWRHEVRCRAPRAAGAPPWAAPPGNRRPTWLILPVAYACLKD